MPFPWKVKSRRYRSLSVSRKRVLVGDADEIVLALILHILQRQGYAVDVTIEAAEFTRRLRAGRYDAVLVDPAVSPGGAQWIRDLVAAMPELRRVTSSRSGRRCESRSSSGFSSIRFTTAQSSRIRTCRVDFCSAHSFSPFRSAPRPRF